jgi:Right handed beta helix region
MKKALLRVTAAAMLALTGMLGGGAKPAYAATTITVNCTTDPSALTSALANATDGDTLAIQGTCNGAFEINHSLTLTGSGGATLDGQGAGRVLTVDPGTSVVVDGLTVTGGSSSFGGGGGLLSLGATVSVRNSTISQNTAFFGAGIDNAEGGVLTLTNSTVTGNSTGINSEAAGILNESFSTLTITNSTISNNDSSLGIRAGGIYNESAATLTVANSTISGNRAFVGGGLYNEATATITNSTIVGNSATSTSSSLGGGGIYNDGGGLTVKASTISRNSASPGSGAGLHDIAFATLEDTILEGQAGDNCSLDNAFGAIADGGYNLEDGTTCGFSSANHSLTNTDPLLDPAGLQDNGGPTQTIALEPGSPAIDAIPVGANGCGTTITTDQRGISRPQGSGCDIGAFELRPPPADLAITKSGAPTRS